MFDHLLELSWWDDSNNWSNIRFGEEIGIWELKILFKQPPKKKKSGKKGKKGKKSGKAKTPTVIDGISTEEMTKEQVGRNFHP